MNVSILHYTLFQLVHLGSLNRLFSFIETTFGDLIGYYCYDEEEEDCTSNCCKSTSTVLSVL